MSWRETWSKWMGSGATVIRIEVLPELGKARNAFLSRAEMMRRYAEMAPNELGRIELGRLGDEDEARARQITDTLITLGGTPPAHPPRAPEGPTVNHWGRLVQALEAHRAAMRLLRETATHLTETVPQTAAMFHALATAEEAHGARLRDLIARTDPQAIN